MRRLTKQWKPGRSGAMIVATGLTVALAVACSTTARQAPPPTGGQEIKELEPEEQELRRGYWIGIQLDP